MELETVLRSIGETITRRASVESVYGQPLQIGDHYYIPVARVQYGLGGGDNAGIVGGGGGMEATPLGVVEVGPAGVSFHLFPTAELAAGWAYEELAPGVGQFVHPSLPRCFLLFHEGEAALVNAPPNAALGSALAREVGSRELSVRYLLINHTDYLHAGALSDLTRLYPEAVLVAHRAVEHCTTFPPTPGAHDPEAWRASLDAAVRVQLGFDDQLWTGELAGEPLLLGYLPEGSWTDQVVIFRGVALAGRETDTEHGPTPEERESLRESLFRSLGDYGVSRVVRSL